MPTFRNTLSVPSTVSSQLFFLLTPPTKMEQTVFWNVGISNLYSDVSEQEEITGMRLLMEQRECSEMSAFKIYMPMFWNTLSVPSTISSQLFFLLTSPTKMEQSSETSAYKLQMPWKSPTSKIQDSNLPMSSGSLSLDTGAINPFMTSWTHMSHLQRAFSSPLG